MKFIATFGLLLRGALLAACIPALSLPALGADTGTAKNGQEAQPIPAALRSAFYHALAKDAGAVYNIDKAGCAVLAKSKLGACFDRHGAHFTGAGSPLALRLVAFGRGGGELAAVGSVRPTFHGNRVTYAHGNLTEWWRVLPVGFEQGFTIAERPSGQGRLTLALAASQPSRHSGEGRNPVKKGIPTSGRDTNSHRRPASAGMTKKNNDNAIAWGKLRYGHLVVTDAGGRVVPATLTSKNNRILIAVNDAGAAYPLTVDPLVWIEQRVTADDGTEGDVFGESVALDGNTALIGADGVTVGGNSEQGAVYVFSKSGTVWTQTQRLTASDGAELDQFGWSVALDGTTALVEARDAMIGFDRVGAAYVFEQSGGVWSQTAKLTASDGALGDQFGFSVALDGTTALVAAEGAKVGPNFNQGAVYVFDASGGSWTQTAKITAGDGASNDQFGHSIALDGTTALVGAWNAEAGANILQGAAYVFEKSGSAWTQTAKLVASDGAAQDRFGSAVALDGTTALVGAFVATVSSEDNAGAAYVFEESGGAWAQTAKLVPSDLAEDFEFGYAVALDGGSALVSAPFAHSPPGSPPDVGIGAVYLFEESGGAWTQTARIVARTSAEQDLIQGFGWSVALDGAIALAGTPVAIIGGNGNQGAAFFYGARDFGLVVSAPATVGRNENYVSQTIATNQSSAISPPVTMTVTVPAAASFISANATQGSCLLQVSETAAPDIVICDLGPISGNAGTATANLTLKAMDPEGTIIANTARIANASPALTASAPTVIGGGNNAPVASNGTLTTEVNTAKSGTLVATDPDGDPLTFSIVAEPTHGSVTLDDASTGAYTYAPDTDYSGSDSFTFKANDGTTDSNTATISITVNSAANNPPVAEDGTLTTEVNTAKGGTLVATDPDGDPLTFSIVAQPEHGGVTLDDASTGAYTYTPDTNYSGSDSFTFKASDGVADSNTATISITVNSAANNPPVAEDGTLTTEVNTAKDGTLVATDPDGDPLTFSIVSQPSHGGVTLDDASTGAYTYTPDTGYSGNDSFTFKASDGVADSNTATIAITVNAAPPPTPPKPPLCNGGCGGFGWLALAGLLGLILVPRYRRKRRDGGRTGAAFKRQAGKATAVLLCALPLTALAAPPGIWTGPYVGARAGVNFGSSDSFDTERAFTFGVEAGYDFQLSPHFVLGGDAFYEWNQDMDHGYCAQGNCQTVSIGSNVYGVEARFGFPVGVSGRFMPYLKLGYARVNFTGDANQCDNGWRYGVGLAFFVGSGNAFSLNVQYSYQKLGSDSDDWSNGNLTLGLSYRF